MSYKSILTVLTRAADAALAVGAAARLAQTLDAHLDVLVLGVDRTQVGYSYIGSGAIMMQVSLDRAEAEARETEAAVKAELLKRPPGLRSSVEAAVTQLGAMNDLVAQRARFADLVVLPRPYGEGKGAESEAVIEAAMFEGKAASFPDTHVLLVNSSHPLVENLLNVSGGSIALADGSQSPASELGKMLCNHIYDLALMAQKGFDAEGMKSFVSRSNQVLTQLTKQ